MLRKLKWQIPWEPLAARYNWCQGPVPGRGPAFEKHWSRELCKQKTLVAVSVAPETCDPHKTALLPSIRRLALSYAQFTWYRIPCHNSTDLWQTSQYTAWQCLYSTTPLIRINWDDETSGYAKKNPDNWIFLRKYATLAVWSSAVTIYSMILPLNLSTTPDLKF